MIHRIHFHIGSRRDIHQTLRIQRGCHKRPPDACLTKSTFFIRFTGRLAVTATSADLNVYAPRSLSLVITAIPINDNKHPLTSIEGKGGQRHEFGDNPMNHYKHLQSRGHHNSGVRTLRCRMWSLRYWRSTHLARAPNSMTDLRCIGLCTGSILHN